MAVNETIRAWKDEAYRLRLTEAEQAALPENPAGLIELSDEEMEMVAGGHRRHTRHHHGHHGHGHHGHGHGHHGHGHHC